MSKLDVFKYSLSGVFSALLMLYGLNPNHLPFWILLIIFDIVLFFPSIKE